MGRGTRVALIDTRISGAYKPEASAGSEVVGCYARKNARLGFFLLRRSPGELTANIESAGPASWCKGPQLDSEEEYALAFAMNGEPDIRANVHSRY